MKAGTVGLGTVGLWVCLAANSLAQARPSENVVLTQTLAGTKITIDYFRPSLRGRDSIIGTQVHWGHVWTPGANRATTIATDRPITIEGRRVEPGRYGVWIHLRRDSTWTFYLHPDTAKWHLPSPAESTMIFAVPVTPRAAAGSRETLSWDFEHIRAGTARLVMWWGRIELPLEVRVEGLPSTRVAQAIGRRYVGRWKETSTRDTTRRRDVDIRYDDQLQQLSYASSTDQFPEAVGARWGMMLVPRSEDIFTIAYSINDEMAHVSEPNQAVFVEFTVENGTAVSYVRRNAQDQVISRAVRQ